MPLIACGQQARGISADVVADDSGLTTQFIWMPFPPLPLMTLRSAAAVPPIVHAVVLSKTKPAPVLASTDPSRAEADIVAIDSDAGIRKCHARAASVHNA